ncbi:hypothetical protein DFH07DRAFT_944567 [Mycena maculata]|uniref:Uncharacterized protein n=1 Tax=Mycena maculata TaxID=230809 RepID=A0AAD7MWM0_9AGAR|nr:hypothetical protein DFH07DRAFT_944567 [Mycena maculata]
MVIVHEIILVCGSTHILHIVKFISDFFSGKATRASNMTRPSRCIQVAILFGNTSEKTSDLLLLDADPSPFLLLTSGTAFVAISIPDSPAYIPSGSYCRASAMGIIQAIAARAPSSIEKSLARPSSTSTSGWDCNERALPLRMIYSLTHAPDTTFGIPEPKSRSRLNGLTAHDRMGWDGMGWD